MSSAIVSKTVLCLFYGAGWPVLDEGDIVRLKLFVVLPRQGKST